MALPGDDDENTALIRRTIIVRRILRIRDDDDSGSSRESSCRLCLAAIFLICYLAMIILAAILKGYIGEWSSLTEANLSVVTSLYISAGTFGILLALCFCADDSDMKGCKIFMYILVLSLQIGAMAYGYLQIADKEDFLRKEITADMKDHFRNYVKDKNIEYLFNGLQNEKDCCGVHGVNDYAELRLKVPSSCCSNFDSMEQYCTNSSLVYPIGCAPKLYNDIIKNIGILTYTGTGFLVFQFILGCLYCIF